MTTAEQFRLINVTPEKPKGEIAGYIKIEENEVWYKRVVRNSKENEWMMVSHSMLILTYFTHLEKLCPFKDKDGGELWEGDIASVHGHSEISGVISFSNETYNWFLILEKSRHFKLDASDCITRIGSIHEEEKCP